MPREPGSRGLLFAIRKQCRWPAPFEIADDCPVPLSSPKSEVIYTDHRQFSTRLRRTTAYRSQQSIIADRHHQAIGKGCRGPAAQRQPQMMDYRLKPPGSSAVTGRNPIAKSFAEDATAAQNGIAPKTAHKNNQLDARPPSGRSAGRRRYRLWTRLL